MGLTVSNNTLLVRDGKLGTEQECCCQQGQGCVCPSGCVDGLEVSLGGSPFCAGGFYYDSVPCAFGAINASMYCTGGAWLVSVSVSCFENGGVCIAVYEAELQCEGDSLPPAGLVELTQTFFSESDNGCPPLPPLVTINK